MKRTTIAVVLTLAWATAPMAEQSVAPVTPVSTPAQEVMGTGFWAALACAGCATGAALTVASGGWVALAAAAFTNPKGLAITAACTGACIRAFD